MNTPKPFGKLGNRGIARLALGLEATLILPDRTIQAKVENVSRVGCCLQMEMAPRVGVTVMVRIEEVEELGTVVWIKGKQCGVNFHSQLAPDAVERFSWIVENFRAYESENLANRSAVWR